jgi:hypothetical protein
VHNTSARRDRRAKKATNYRGPAALRLAAAVRCAEVPRPPSGSSQPLPERRGTQVSPNGADLSSIHPSSGT